MDRALEPLGVGTDGYDRSPKQIRDRADAEASVVRKHLPWGSPRRLSQRVTTVSRLPRLGRARRRVVRVARRTRTNSARAPGRSTGGDEPPPPPDLSRVVALAGGQR